MVATLRMNVFGGQNWLQYKIRAQWEQFKTKLVGIYPLGQKLFNLKKKGQNIKNTLYNEGWDQT